MKEKKYVSIKVTIIRILIFAGVLFSILLGGILFSVKRIILSISSEYTSMTSEKMESELEMMYEKMDVFFTACRGRRIRPRTGQPMTESFYTAGIWHRKPELQKSRRHGKSFPI